MSSPGIKIPPERWLRVTCRLTRCGVHSRFPSFPLEPQRLSASLHTAANSPRIFPNFLAFFV